MNDPDPILEVAVPAPVAGPFDYLPPAEGPGPLPGQRVLVPFGRSTRVGLLLRLKEHSDLPAGKLRRAHRLLDTTPLLAPDLLGLIVWAARYYQHPVGEVFAAAIPKALRTGGGMARGAMRYGLTAAGHARPAGDRVRAPVQEALAAALSTAATGLTAGELALVHPGWRQALKGLLKRGLVAATTPALMPGGPPAAPDIPPVLTEDQAVAVAAIGAARGYQGFLLDGVTGSGKTEVYLRCIADAVAGDRQSLVLVPEIGLTPQLLERFRRRFPVPIVELHSGLTDGERLRAWTLARDGSARIVVGTRSAVFAPLPKAGLIIVDEEHDASLKQQEGFRYSARDLAVWRARELGIPLVLGSATPSLESLANVAAGRYTRLVLSARTGRAGPPRLGVVDLRSHPARDGLSQPLLAAITRHLSTSGQVLLYLNRRGFAPTLLCPGCGWLATCRRCDARLVYHRDDRAGGGGSPARLTCHHCGAEQVPPSVCPDCQGALRPVGQGTQRLEQALARAFPGEEVVRIDRDTTRRRGEIGRRLDRVRSAGARLLLGTQMLTKGHDFPGVTLVGIVDADQGLFGTDFRSAERLAQTFIQVAGRAGRADRPGEVLIQTLFPDHPLLRVLIGEGYGAFADLALAERRRAGWPPYSHLALLRAEAAGRPAVFGFLEEALRLAGPLAVPAGAVRLLGPAPAPMERRSGRFRGQLLVQAGARVGLHRFLPPWLAGLAALPSGRRVRWSLDVDPLELF